MLIEQQRAACPQGQACRLRNWRLQTIRVEKRGWLLNNESMSFKSETALRECRLSIRERRDCVHAPSE